MTNPEPTAEASRLRKWAALWLLLVLLNGLFYGPLVIKGFIWDLNGEIAWDTLLNHRLINLGRSFCALAMFSALFLLLRPTWRPLWRGSLGLMAGAALTNLGIHMHLHMHIGRGVMSGLKSFVTSGDIAHALAEKSFTVGSLVDSFSYSVGFQKAGYLIWTGDHAWSGKYPDYAAHDGTVVVSAVWILGLSALLTGFIVHAATWLKARRSQQA
jgi:hypothetical protein